MNIIIPENINTGDLELLPKGVAVAMLEKLILGTSQTNNPKLTARYTIVEEMSEKMPDGSPTMGKIVLDTISLQEKALFKLAKIYKDASGEPLPHGEYSKEEFTQKMIDALCGKYWNLELDQELDNKGEIRTKIVKQTVNSSF